jgi:hypothetical protein
MPDDEPTTTFEVIEWPKPGADYWVVESSRRGYFPLYQSPSIGGTPPHRIPRETQRLNAYAWLEKHKVIAERARASLTAERARAILRDVWSVAHGHITEEQREDIDALARPGEYAHDTLIRIAGIEDCPHPSFSREAYDWHAAL